MTRLIRILASVVVLSISTAGCVGVDDMPIAP